MSDGKRVFSETEASDVLQRAARLQEERVGSAPPSGLTEDDLARIAAEAGIDPKNLETAIRSLAEKPERRGPFRLVRRTERVVNAELSPDEFDVILEVAPPARVRRHPVSQVGRMMSMRTRYKGGTYLVDVSSRNGQTRINVASWPFMAYLMSLHPAIIIAVIGAMSIAGANGGGQGASQGGALFAVISLMIGVFAFLGLVRRNNSFTGELANALEARVLEATDEARQRLRGVAAPTEDGVPPPHVNA